ncbi:hypothetical protein ACS0TY_032528 [Phlomoides rotata]
MDLPEKLLKFKLQILFFFAFSFLIFFICYVAPRFVDILYYFWPLLFSTALFLVAIIVFGEISPPAEVPVSLDEKLGEGLLNYVASEPEHMQSIIEETGGSVHMH